MLAAVCSRLEACSSVRALMSRVLDAITPRTRVVFITNPNNPTGVTVSHDAIRTVAARKRGPRDGRFIEQLGFYNPLLPKDHADRLKLDIEKAKVWLSKGATASDRVHRFLADAGVLKHVKHHSPQKMLPKKKAQERAAAAAKAAGTGDAAA